MNKHLNNWLDKVEGKKVGTTNENIEKEIKRQGYQNLDRIAELLVKNLNNGTSKKTNR